MRQNFRTFLRLFVPLTLLTALVFAFAYRYEHDLIVKELLLVERQHVDSTRIQIESRLAGIRSDLRVLAQLPDFRFYLTTGSDNFRTEIEAVYLVFSREKKIYDQVRYIDEEGKEKIRVNYNNGEAHLVADSDLADKGDRYYFQEAMALPPGEIFTSQFDLNVELGYIERPFKPVIRFATRVTDSEGVPHGVVILNYLGRSLVEEFRRLMNSPSVNAMLLNRNGYWLVAPNAEDEWGFMLPHNANFAKRYPNIWPLISSGAGQFQRDGELWTYAVVTPEQGAIAGSRRQYGNMAMGHWIIVSQLDRAYLNNALRPLRQRILFSAVSGMLLIFAFSFWYGRNRARTDVLAAENIRHTRSLQDQQRLLRLFITHVPAAVAMLDRNLNFLAVSNRWLEDYDLNPEIVGHSISTSMPELAVHWAKVFDHSLHGAMERCDEERIEHGEGDAEWLRWEVRPWYTSGNEIGGIVMLTESITEQKRAEAVRDEFVAKVSHELRTPLTVISATLRLLTAGGHGQVDEEAHTILTVAERNSQRLLRLVNDLLDLQQIKLGKMQFTNEPVTVIDVVNNAVDAIRVIAEPQGIQVLIDNRAENCRIRGDAERLGQVVTNLLANAVKFSPAGGEIVATVMRDKRGVTVIVADQGSGVPNEFADKIFQDFAQADKGNVRSPGGAGLGLAISRLIIEQFGGSMAYRNRAGGGAEFYFTLPELGE